MTWTATLAEMCAPVGMTAGVPPFVAAGVHASAWAVADWGVLGAFEVDTIDDWRALQEAFIDAVEALESRRRLQLGTLDAWLVLVVRQPPPTDRARHIQLDTALCRKHVLPLDDEDPVAMLSAITCVALPDAPTAVVDASGAGKPFYARAAAAKDLGVLRTALADIEAGR